MPAIGNNLIDLLPGAIDMGAEAHSYVQGERDRFQRRDLAGQQNNRAIDIHADNRRDSQQAFDQAEVMNPERLREIERMNEAKRLANQLATRTQDDDVANTAAVRSRNQALASSGWSQAKVDKLDKELREVAFPEDRQTARSDAEARRNRSEADATASIAELGRVGTEQDTLDLQAQSAKIEAEVKRRIAALTEQDKVRQGVAMAGGDAAIAGAREVTAEGLEARSAQLSEIEDLRANLDQINEQINLTVGASTAGAQVETGVSNANAARDDAATGEVMSASKLGYAGATATADRAGEMSRVITERNKLLVAEATEDEEFSRGMTEARAAAMEGSEAFVYGRVRKNDMEGALKHLIDDPVFDLDEGSELRQMPDGQYGVYLEDGETLAKDTEGNDAIYDLSDYAEKYDEEWNALTEAEKARKTSGNDKGKERISASEERQRVGLATKKISEVMAGVRDMDLGEFSPDGDYVLSELGLKLESEVMDIAKKDPELVEVAGSAANVVQRAVPIVLGARRMARDYDGVKSAEGKAVPKELFSAKFIQDTMAAKGWDAETAIARIRRRIDAKLANGTK